MASVFLISAFGSIDSASNSRVANIFFALDNSDVEFITTDFNHRTKEYKISENKKKNEVFIPVPAYKNNISIFRLFSHIVFAFRLFKFLNTLKNKPDLVYCTMPTTLAAFFSGRYCKKNKIPFVIDVIDIWPQSLYPLTKLSFLLKFLCYPWQLVANYTYGLADLLLAESKKYLETAGKHNKKAIKKYYYLGVDKNTTQELIKLSSLKPEKPTDEIWICYGGQLGTSYGFEPIIEALKSLNKNQIKYKFWFVGDGEKRPEIEEKIRENNLNAEVTGFMNYPDFLKYLSCCDIAINIFKENTKVVHSYKFNDYVATGLFVLNSLKGETSEMVESYEIGFNFDFGANNLTSVLLEVCRNWKKYQKWKTNCSKLIKEKLDKKMIYSNLTKNMLNLIK